MKIEALTERLLLEWQFVFDDTLANHSILPNSDIAKLLSKISDLEFDIARQKMQI